mmetsp:Transcript_25914/g.46030  ORF Transcript_25914/g.46030 Transcript_25914/m.46030 type:complete len:259 (+) Transcript_25914:30-806(+)
MFWLEAFDSRCFLRMRHQTGPLSDLIPIEKVLPRHRLLTRLQHKRRLNALSISAQNRQIIVNNIPWFRFTYIISFSDLRLENFIPLLLVLEEGAGHRRQAMYQVEELLSRPLEVQPAVLRLYFSRVCHPLLALCLRSERMSLVDDVQKHVAAQLREAVVQDVACGPCRYWVDFSGEDWASIHAFIELHDTHACLLVTCHKSSGQGGGAPPARQEGGVDVEASILLCFEDCCGQQEAVGCHRCDVRVDTRKLFFGFCRL